MPQKRLKITSFHKSAKASNTHSEEPNDRAAEGNSGFQIRMTSFYLIPTTELKKLVTCDHSSSSGSTCSYIGEKRNKHSISDSFKQSTSCSLRKTSTNGSSRSSTNECALSNISDSLLQSPHRRNSNAGSSGRANSPCSSTADPNGEEVDSSTPIRANTMHFKTTSKTSEYGEENSRSAHSDLADSTIAQVIDYNIGEENTHSTDADLANSTISQAIDTWEDHGLSRNKKLLSRKPNIVKDHQTVMNTPRRFYQEPVLNFQYPLQNSHNYIAPLNKPPSFNFINHGRSKETDKFLADINQTTTKKTTTKKTTTKKIAKSRSNGSQELPILPTSNDLPSLPRTNDSQSPSTKLYASLEQFQADIPKEENLPEKPHVPLQDGHPLIPSKTDTDPYERKLHRELKMEGTRFHFIVLANLDIARMKSGDIRGKRIDSMPLGYHGMTCRYCRGVTRQLSQNTTGLGRSGRYFPLSLKTMADSQKTLGSIYNHLTRCPDVPLEVKSAVMTAKATHNHDRKALRRGSQQKFYRILWKRLHGVKDCNADAPGPGTQRGDSKIIAHI